MKRCKHCLVFTLTPVEHNIVKVVERSQSVTSKKVSLAIGKSLESASMALKRFADAGLMTREEKPQPSGGYEFEYRLNPGSKYELR